MSPIDPLGPLLTRIRSHAADLKRKDAEAAAGPDDGAATPATESHLGLMDGVLSSIAGLPPELPNRRRRSFRLYLEAVVAHELAVEDPHSTIYQDLVDRVLRSMESDGRLRRAIDETGEVLIRMADQRRRQSDP